VGTLVSNLVDFASPAGQVDNVTDPDVGALLGIAVKAADTANGSWWYSTNGETGWSALGSVSNTYARLLAADANSRLYFQPNTNYFGTLTNAITFHAWDQTSGTSGATAALISNETNGDNFGTPTTTTTTAHFPGLHPGSKKTAEGAGPARVRSRSLPAS